MREFGSASAVGAGRLLSVLFLVMTTCGPALDRPIPESVAEFEQHFQNISFDPIQVTVSERLHGWTAGDGLLARLLMYEAKRKIEYLEQFTEGAERLLALRDSERGLPDSLGRLLPVWRTEDSYMGKQDVLRNSEGVPVLSMVTPNIYAWRDSDMGGPDTVEVRHLDQARFALTLTLTLRYGGSSTSILWNNLTMDREQKRPDALYAPLRFDPEQASFVPQSRALYGEDSTNTLRPWNRLNLFDLHAPDEWSSGMPSEGTFELVEGRFARSSNTGLAAYPLAYFARIVRESEELQNRKGWKSLAERYLEAARQALAVYDDDWRENEKGEGWYVNPLSAPVYNAGREEAINRFILLSLPQIELWRVTGEELYRDRIKKLAVGLKNEMRYVEEIDAYVWPYWRHTGDVWREIGGDQGGEDIHHAGVNVLFAYKCYRNGIVFDQADLRRLANTWMANVVREDGTFADLIDGRSAARTRSPAIQWRWSMLGTEDRRPFEVAHRWYEQHAESWKDLPPEAEQYDPDPIAKKNNLRHRMRLGWAALAWAASQIAE